jgi:hypothetical protein
MKLYSDYPAQRVRQVLADIGAVILVYVWVRVGMWVRDQVMAFAEFGEDMEGVGAGLRTTFTDIGTAIDDVPLIGDGLSAPFASAANTAADIEQAGIAQQQTVADIAVGLGVGIAAFPIVTILALWLTPRIYFAVRASRLRSLVASGVGMDLLALRAIARQRPRKLLEVDPNPADAWRRGDALALRRLANLEMRGAGLRLTDLSLEPPAPGVAATQATPPVP